MEAEKDIYRKARRGREGEKKVKTKIKRKSEKSKRNGNRIKISRKIHNKEMKIERFPNTRGKERRLSGENLYNKISWTWGVMYFDHRGRRL